MISKPSSCISCQLACPPYGSMQGYVPASGPTGPFNGVLIVGEAAGKDEAIEGVPFVGKSGYSLFQQLKRIDIERDGFMIHNVLSCQPQDNKLVGQPYEKEAIAHCAPNLDATIERAKQLAKGAGKTFVIVTLGVTPFKRILGFDSKKNADLLKLDYYAYPFWSDTYACWVYNAPHPAYLLRGQTHLWPIVHFVFKRALDVAEHGLRIDTPDYLIDPNVDVESFHRWVDGYIRSLRDNPDNPLSYDIETPYKKKVGDEEEIAKEEDADHTILRISFSYAVGDQTYTVSVKWSAEFMADIERLFDTAPYVLGWNSDKYDYPRVSRHVRIRGIGLDGMVAWHILNTSLPKALGFVTPYYWQNTYMWKHLGDKEPAFYNAKDADAALRNYIGIKRDLIANKLWHVYERHWIELSKALKYMSGMGVLRDNEMRAEAEAKLSAQLDDIEKKMEGAVPVEARKIKIYKKAPKVIEGGMFQLEKEFPEKFCSGCGIQNPSRWKKHAQLCSGELKDVLEKYCVTCGLKDPKKSKDHDALCVGKEITELPVPQLVTVETELLVPTTVWGKPLEFKVSKLGMINYQKSLKHQAVVDRKEKKITFNADAITLLVKKYPNDPLYPLILDHRKTQKLLSNYIGITEENGLLRGGMPIGKDGRIHTVYSRDASTLRFTSSEPNLQNLPRPNGADPGDPVNIIRNLIVAGPGNILYARDYSGIEAVLTGYFALDPKYIRLAKQDVHTYYTVYALYELEGGKRIQAADLPDLSWPDERLFPYLAELKKRFKSDRNNLYKHLVHAANFMQGAKGAQAKIFSETGVEYPVKTVQKVMDVYYSLFPKIKQWHKNVLDEAEKDGYLRNPFDYVHRFNRVYDYKKIGSDWIKTAGEEANQVVAFKPQSTAVGIITEAILRLFAHRYDEAGRFLRLQVHDELLLEIPRDCWQRVDSIVKEEMERPVQQMRCPASWGMGEHLVVLTEAKADLNEPSRWGSMRGL